jgi:cytochrome c-type biogenesis protein CcmE
MKTIHIIIILVLVAAVAVIITTLTDASTYSDFEQALKKPGKEFHIIGVLNKQKPIEYDAKVNVNRFAFYLVDDKGLEKKVVYNNTKPQDFEKSDKVVVIGSMKGDEFQAKSLLLKCPSKYKADKTPEKFGSKDFKAK